MTYVLDEKKEQTEARKKEKGNRNIETEVRKALIVIQAILIMITTKVAYILIPAIVVLIASVEEILVEEDLQLIFRYKTIDVR